jgi:Na+-driven multidrug efflux pump
MDQEENLRLDTIYSKPLEFKRTFEYAKSFSHLLPHCLAVGSNFIYANLMTSLGLHFASLENNDETALQQSEFGITTFLSTIFFVAISNGVIEKATIEAGLVYANNDRTGIARVFYQGLLMLLGIHLVFFCPLVYTAQHWIWILNYSPSSGVKIQHYFTRLFWILMISHIVLYMISIATTVVPDIRISALSAINLMTGAGLVYYYCWYLEKGLEGWFLSCMWHQALRVVLYVPYCLHKLKNLKIFRITLQFVFQGLGKFFWEGTLFLLAIYTEQIALEISTFLTTMTHSHVQIAAQTSFVNMTYYFYEFSFGFGLVGRSKFAFLHQRSASIKTAKRFFTTFLIGMVLIAVVISGFLYRFSDWLILIYAGKNQQVRYYLVSLIKLFCVALWANFSLNLVFTILRTIEYLVLSTVLYVFMTVVVQIAAGLILVQVLHLDVFWIMFNYHTIEFATVLLGVLMIYTYKRPADLFESFEELEPANE